VAGRDPAAAADDAAGAAVGVEGFDGELQAQSSRESTRTAAAQVYGFRFTSLTTGLTERRFRRLRRCDG
jgi:hypothetical protein